MTDKTEEETTEPWPRLRQVEDEVWMLEDGDKDIDSFNDLEEAQAALDKLLQSRGLIPYSWTE